MVTPFFKSTSCKVVLVAAPMQTFGVPLALSFFVLIFLWHQGALASGKPPPRRRTELCPICTHAFSGLNFLLRSSYAIFKVQEWLKLAGSNSPGDRRKVLPFHTLAPSAASMEGPGY